MHTMRLSALALLGLVAGCRSPDASRIGRPGDPGYVGEQALGSSAAHAGPIEGDFVGSIFHVSYYQQPGGRPMLVGLEYGAFDVEHGDYWLHVALWGSGQLPQALDLATYRALNAYGVLEPARVEFAHTPHDGADAQDLRRASAGHLQFKLEAGHAALALTDLVWAVNGAGELAVTHGQAEGDVAYHCYLYQPHTLESPRMMPGERGLKPLPSPDVPQALYVEDVGFSSKFCAAVLHQAVATP